MPPVSTFAAWSGETGTQRATGNFQHSKISTHSTAFQKSSRGQKSDNTNRDQQRPTPRRIYSINCHVLLQHAVGKLSETETNLRNATTHSGLCSQAVQVPFERVCNSDKNMEQRKTCDDASLETIGIGKKE